MNTTNNKLPNKRTRGRLNKQVSPEQKEKIIARLERVTKKKWKHFILEYFCSEDGQIWNEETRQFEKCVKLKNGYRQYTLSFKGKRNGRLAHRIVGYCFDDDVTAEMFIDSNNFKAHHIDFDKKNDNYINICYLHVDIHNMIHSAVKKGEISKDDINTRDKLMQYLETTLNAA